MFLVCDVIGCDKGYCDAPTDIAQLLLPSFKGCETLRRGMWLRGRDMQNRDAAYDYHRYRKLLAEAVDESKRLALIDVLIEERAQDRLRAARAADRDAATAATIAKVLGIPRT